MFFGLEITPKAPSALSSPSQSFQTLILNNIALSKNSFEAQLYLHIGDQEILICELNRAQGILQHSLNLTIDLKDQPQLKTKIGNVNVCGYYQTENSNKAVHQSNSQVESTTNKKSNPLESKFEKAGTLPAQTATTSWAPRQSSRLSSRRISQPNPEPTKVESSSTTSEQKPEKSLKKDQKQQKKLQKKKPSQDKALLSNGRYSLKALLENAQDDDDSDESSVAFDQDDESDDDSDSEDDDDFNEDDSEEEKKTNKKTKKTTETEEKNDSKQSEQEKTKSKNQRREPIEVIEEESSEKVELNTEEVQQKQRERSQSPQISEKDMIQKQIKRLADKMKAPTFKPKI